jgi:exopolyphosphatase/guanosine-5'-triphosphate,3'-diphosphate pyrophosphatase
VNKSTLKLETLAAVDLGSNSFHLQIGRVVDDQIYLLDSLREPVRLGGGLTRDGRIDRPTQLRALEALGRFGERLRGFSRSAVRAVGTNALRIAKNSEQFLAEARETLGFPVEVVFGREEARLIYLGVAHTSPPSPDRRLVFDIGGGSTEFIVGTGYDPEIMESLSMGSVSWSQRFFPDGRMEKSDFKRAEVAAANELQRIVEAYRKSDWKQAMASSGTAKSIASVLETYGWSERGITADGLERLRSYLIKAGDVERVKLPGLREDRVVILPGGLAIMSAVVAGLGIHELQISQGALRQGVLYDLLGRVSHHDMREATVRQFMRRYHVDAAQAERVEHLAMRICTELTAEPAEQDLQLLRFACCLHEIGISIAHAGYHKHSAYILSQADMPGFSRDEQERLARLTLAHRGRLNKLEGLSARSADWTLVLALRLATLIYLSRGDFPLPPFACKASDTGYTLSIPRSWLDEHPLSEAALDAEAEEWRALGIRFDVRGVGEERAQALG